MTALDFLKGVGGGLKPRPELAAPDFIDRGNVAIQKTGDYLGLNVQLADCNHLTFAQATCRAILPLKQGPMRDFIGVVFLRRGPPKIVRSIIEAISVIVGHLMSWRRGRPAKGFTDQPVNRRIFNLSGFANQGCASIPHAAPTPTLLQNVANFCTTPMVSAWCVAPNPAEVGNAVKWRVGDCYPFFFGIIKVSHSEITLRVGQGRALLAQCFRPALFSRFPAETQGEMAC